MCCKQLLLASHRLCYCRCCRHYRYRCSGWSCYAPGFRVTCSSQTPRMSCKPERPGWCFSELRYPVSLPPRLPPALRRQPPG